MAHCDLSNSLDPLVLAQQLAERGLIVPTGAVGAPGRSAVFEDVLARLDALILRVAAPDRVESLTFPPVIDRSILERTGYLESFPHLCGAVHSFSGPERAALALRERVNAREPWGDLLQMTDVVLAPAACYPLYPTCAGTLPDGGRHVTLIGWVYRQEPSHEPTRMRAFRVREIIRIGAPDTVVQWVSAWRERGLELLRSLALDARCDVAADPFFGRGGKMLAAGQIDQKLKFEVLIPVISASEPTACCSFNYHQDKFASAFAIRTADGALAHSACLGFGMERVTMALFQTHGFEPSSWPEAVRARLWP